MELIVQPPAKALPRPLALGRKRFPRPNGSSYTPLIAAACLTSKFASPQSARRLKGLEANAGSPPDVVALGESPSSSVFDHVYTPRSPRPALKRWFTSNCSAW